MKDPVLFKFLKDLLVSDLKFKPLLKHYFANGTVQFGRGSFESFNLFLVDLDHSAKVGYPYPEKLVHVVGIDPKKSHPFHNRHLFIQCLLQDPFVEA